MKERREILAPLKQKFNQELLYNMAYMIQSRSLNHNIKKINWFEAYYEVCCSAENACK